MQLLDAEELARSKLERLMKNASRESLEAAKKMLEDEIEKVKADFTVSSILLCDWLCC